jgi:hypothetical protein
MLPKVYWATIPFQLVMDRNAFPSPYRSTKPHAWSIPSGWEDTYLWSNRLDYIPNIFVGKSWTKDNCLDALLFDKILAHFYFLTCLNYPFFSWQIRQ